MNKNDFLYLIGLIISIPFLIVVSIYLSIARYLRRQNQCKSIAGEVAVVTGAGRGLGRDIAIELAKRGCHIAIVDILDKLALETAEYIANTYHVKTKAYKIDVSDYHQLEELQSKVTTDLGDVTILVNNAAVLLTSVPPKLEEIQKMINVNFTAVCFANAIFLPKMKTLNRGYILTISSIAALITVAEARIYAATKSALRSLTTALRIELKNEKKNITSTTVMPWFMTTNKLVECLVDFSFLTKVCPILDGKIVAQQAVDGMLNGEEEMTLPLSLYYFYIIFELLPTSVKDLFLSAFEKYFGNIYMNLPEAERILKTSNVS